MLLDLRSDTVTRPTAAMRNAMASATVGDDVYGEDPAVTELELATATLLGKESALFVPSGTMANQIALLLHTRPGDEVIVSEGAHLMWNESGAGAAWSGVQFAVAGSGAMFGEPELLAAIKPDAYYLPRTSLVALENTHNRGGGRVLPSTLVAHVATAARERGLLLHLDGARLWNAAVATGLPVAELARDFDTVSVCYSKGLGAPVGSALAGPREAITRARRLRKMLGGGMREAGIIAAAASYALEHHRERLADDHAAARTIAGVVADAPGVRIDLGEVETNIVRIELVRARPARVVELARERGVAIAAMDGRTLRAVTHLDVSAQAQAAATRLAEAIAAADTEAAA
jgi:threonine aldolase